MLPPKYDPKSYEESMYVGWEKSGYFKPIDGGNISTYSMVIPPPNITGQLHMGHALNNSIQDIIIRYKRMQGYSTLWVPGTDHASIATEVKIVEQLKEEGLTKEGIGRAEFLRRAHLWKENYGGKIAMQLRRLGSSCDWSRECFTMDEKCSKAVIEAFVNLYEKGYIYKGNKPINWCPSCLTALSDAEVVFEEEKGFLWHIKYPFVDGSGYIVVATTRPETMLGDTAVAVNGKDKRYIDKIGKYLKLPLTDREIQIIADDYVEMDFGTGAVKITPAHDPNDFEIGIRHALDLVTVIDEKGYINENGFAYRDLSREQARKKIVEDLQKGGYLEKTEKYMHNVGSCYRCSTIIEPRVCPQWFVRMDELAKPAIDIVKEKKTSFIPDRFSKIYFNWMENIRDWCISRQLWWGHRIPAYYCTSCGTTIVSKTHPTQCNKCASKEIVQDEDVLDTWFSSALWPFSTMGYPDATEDLKRFYPTDLLVTAYDIIFFWVARMIFSGIEHMGKTPFPEVLIHGLVRDAQGRKMSKSLGNGIDPIEMIDKYGADALRFSLCMGVAPGSDIRFSEDKIESARNFVNKLWNASKFVLSNLEGENVEFLVDALDTSDKWILHKLNTLSHEIEKNMKKYELGLVSIKLYDFIWSEVCDWYLEISKSSIYGDDLLKKKAKLGVLKFVLLSALKLLHPLIPFVTERIWKNIDGKDTIMFEKYPIFSKSFVFKKDYKEFEFVKDTIRSIRNLRAELGVEASKKIKVLFITESKEIVEKSEDSIKRLAGISSIDFVDEANISLNKMGSIVVEKTKIFIPLDQAIDKDKELARIQKEIDAVVKEINRAQSMLNNPGFLGKAPPALISKEKVNLDVNQNKLVKLNEMLASVLEL